jgi:toxin ParE1/3/4
LTYSLPAKADLKEIGEYTWRVWGIAQTHIYLDKLEDCCKRVNKFQQIGRACEHLAPDLRRLECGKHVIFYLPTAKSTRIVRILHQDMLPERRDFIDANA